MGSHTSYLIIVAFLSHQKFSSHVSSMIRNRVLLAHLKTASSGALTVMETGDWDSNPRPLASKKPRLPLYHKPLGHHNTTNTILKSVVQELYLFLNLNFVWKVLLVTVVR